MGTVYATRGSNHFPCVGNPQTAQGEAVAGTAAGALATVTSTPTALAGAIGTFTVNNVSRVLDLTQWGQKDIINWINANVISVTASISQTGNRLVLQSAIAITIAGDAAVLACLGLSAGTTAA